MRSAALILLIAASLAAGIFVMRDWREELILPPARDGSDAKRAAELPANAFTEKFTEEAVAEEGAAAEPDIFVSARRLEQGDTLLVIVEGAPPLKSAFGADELEFFSAGAGRYASFLGVDAKAEAGAREIVVQFRSGGKFREIVDVARRDFPVTELRVSEDLARRGYTPAGIAETLAREEGPNVREIVSGRTPEAYFGGGFTNPLAKMEIVGAFGNIRKNGESSVQHLGIDLEAEAGTPVFAIAGGKVVYADHSQNYGNALILDHGFGVYSLYLHLAEFKAAQGAEVKKGEAVALSGSSGYSISPHLHLSMKVGGASVDPLRFLEVAKTLGD